MTHEAPMLSDGDESTGPSTSLVLDDGGQPVMGAGSSLPRELRHGLSVLDTLTTRERVILRMLAAGMGNRAVARSLGIQESTVKRHMSALLTKLGVASRLQAGLVAFAARLDGQLPMSELLSL